MSTIENLSGEESLDFSKEQLDGVYEWHASKVYESYEALPNPFYLAKGCIHLTGAALSCFPGASLLVKIATKFFMPGEKAARYFLFLKRGAFEKAYYIARTEHLDLSLKDGQGRTLADRLLDCYPLSPSRFALLRQVLLEGGEADLTHQNLRLVFYNGLYRDDYDLCAQLIGKGFSTRKDDVNPSLLLNKKKALPSLDVGPLKPYIENITEAAFLSLCDYIQPRALEIKQVTQIFTFKEKNFPLIYSKAGFGKTTLVHELARSIAEEKAPSFLSRKVVLALDWRKLISDIGRKDITLKLLNQALQNLSGKAVIFLDNLEWSEGETLAAILNKGNISLDDLFGTLMAHSEIEWIAACSDKSFTRLKENPWIERFFFPYQLEEPGKEGCYRMIRGFSKQIELLYDVQVDPDCLESLVEQTKRYLPDACYPKSPADVLAHAAVLINTQKSFGPLKIQRLQEDLFTLTNQQIFLENSSGRSNQSILDSLTKKINQIEQEIKALSRNLDLEKTLLEEKNFIRKQLQLLCQLLEKLTDNRLIEPLLEKKLSLENQEKALNVRLASTDQAYTRFIDHSVIAYVLSKLSRIPITQLTADEKARLKELDLFLKRRVKGQEEAIKAVSDTIRRSSLGLNGDNHPRGSFLFLGPTGVGKTELAKSLAEVLYGNENQMIRIDMSEFQDQVDINRLIGSAPGYIGYEEKGRLTEALKKRPYSIVLVDELEKAHPAVIDLFLQVLDDGRLTDGHGDTVSCKEAIFIMTSNIGTEAYSLPKEKQKSALDEALKAKLRPEFINRFDEILPFNALDSQEIVKKIAVLQLENLQKKVEKLFKISIFWSENIVEFLANKGFSPIFGARPLKRLVEKDLMTLISDAVLNETLQQEQSACFEVSNDKVILSTYPKNFKN